MEKKKIFICITKSNWGGAQKYVFDLATNLPKDTFDVSVLLGGDGELKKRLDQAGIRTVMLKNSQRDINMFKVFLLGFSLIRIFLKEKPDIVHLNSSQMGGSGGLAARLAGVKKIIFTGHGWAFNEDRPGWQKILARFFHVLTIFLSHKTIAVSQITKDQIGAPWNKKMVVIRNGLREINFKGRDEARESLSIKILKNNPKSASVFEKNPLWIGTISELHKSKGLKYAIEAISQIHENIIFLIISDGEEKKNLEDLIIKLGVSEKVFLTGRVEEGSTYLKAFDILTMTSITEALPYFLLEAGAASLPVIASKVGGIPEIIEDGKTGFLLAPRDPETIKKSLEELIKSPEKRKTLGNNLKEKVDKEFSIKEMIDKTIALYSRNTP